MQNKTQQIAALRLKAKMPNEYQQCKDLATPRLTDLKLLDQLFEFIAERYKRTPENAHIIVSIVYSLYCPYKLIFQETRIPNNMRQPLCDFMGWQDRPSVNHYSNIAMAYYKNNRFRASIENLANEFLSTLENEN